MMEGASYILTSSENNEILQIIEQTMKTIMEHSDENGYFNSHFNVKYQTKDFGTDVNMSSTVPGT